MKEWAYLYQTGYQRITAAEAARRRKVDGGETRGVTYFSRHAAGDRSSMRLIDPKVRATPAHFGYLTKPADHADRLGSEESIQHSLFKQALASIETTRLTWKGESHLIHISEAAPEVTLHVGDSKVRPDVLWRFTSDSLLDKKWGSVVYVEVCHKHPVPDTKLRLLKAASIPVIEIKIPDYLLFSGGEDASEGWQNNYLEHAKRQLENPARFLPYFPISNPSSPGFTKVWNEWTADKQALERAQRELTSMQALAADDRQALRRSVSELRRFIPTIAPLLPLQAVPEFVLVRAIDLKAPPTAAHKPANSAASWHPAYWTILGALVVAMVGALWVLLSGSTTDSSSVDVGQAPPSGVAASALPPEPGHPAAIHRLASHPKKVTKKKGVLKPANDAASSPGGEAATEPAPLQSFYEVAPSTSEETTSSESPAQ